MKQTAHLTRSGVALFSVVLLVALSLAGCAPNASSSDQGKTVLSWMEWVSHDWGDDFVRLEIIAPFEGSHLRIKVMPLRYQFSEMYHRYLDLIKDKGTFPDVLYLAPEWYAELAANGFLEKLGPYLEREPVEFKEDFLPSTLPEWNGELYALPTLAGATAVFYNADLFNRIGAQVPESRDDFIALSARIPSLQVGVASIGLCLGGKEPNDSVWYSFFPWLYAAGGVAINGQEAAINSDAALRVMEFWYQLANSPGALNSDFETASMEDLRQGFRKGKIAMHVDGPWFLRKLREKPPQFKYGVFPLPKDIQDGACSNAQLIAISANSQHKEEAWEFVRHMVSEATLSKIALQTGFLPPRKSLLNLSHIEQDAELRVFADALASPNTHLTGLIPEYEVLGDFVIRRIMVNCIVGKQPRIKTKSPQNYVSPLAVTREDKLRVEQEVAEQRQKLASDAEARREFFKNELDEAAKFWNERLSRYFPSDRTEEEKRATL